MNLLRTLFFSIQSFSMLLLSACDQSTPVSQNGVHRYIAVVSPTLTEGERQAAFAQLLSLTLEKLKPGDSLTVIDAMNLAPVAELEVPNDPLFDAAKPRLTRLAGAIGQIKEFFRRENAPTPPAQPGEFHMDRLCHYLAQSPALKVGGSRAIVLVFGQPFYHDAQESAWDFGPEDGSYPSDGFLALPPLESAFSTVGKANALRGVVFHWATFTNRWKNHAQEEAVMHFWHGYLHEQGAILATATNDPAMAIQRAVEGFNLPLFSESPKLDDKPEMRIVRHERAPVAASTSSIGNQAQSAPVEFADPPEFLRTETQVTSTVPVQTTGNERIGLRWGKENSRNPIDLDLYVKFSLAAREIFYKVCRTPEGFLHKDWQTSPMVVNGFEIVESSHPVDLKEVSCWVNFFAGHNPGGVDATIRLWIEGATYEGRLHIPASDGNHGAHADERQNDPHWVKVDVMQIVKLR